MKVQIQNYKTMNTRKQIRINDLPILFEFYILNYNRTFRHQRYVLDTK